MLFEKRLNKIYDNKKYVITTKLNATKIDIK
jgi:hypothetical protein